MITMDGRPLKRQRRSGGQSSQSDPKPIALSSRPKPARARASPAPSTRLPSSSPSPAKTPPKQANPQSKSLHNFFQPASEGQRWSTQKFEPKRPTMAPVVSLDADEIEDDYDSYDEIFTQHIASQKTDAASNAVPAKPPPAKSKAKASARAKPQPSKRFLMASRSNDNSRQSTPPGSLVDIDGRPWSQRFAPIDLDELAVHKRKVSDVQRWLEEVFAGTRNERLLVLRGPAGSGKTTTLSLLSEAVGFDIVEWRNPAAADYTMQGYVSVSAQFDEFLGRGDRFGGLEFENGVESSSRFGTSQGQRVLLVEEFPTVLSRNSSSLAAFRASLQRYLAAASGALDGNTHPPIVMIVSETLLSSTSSVSDNFTVHRLLGPALYNHPGTSIIDFNRVAPTYMQKALRLVLEKEAQVSQRGMVPGQAVLDTISDTGDIRSAISSLEFLCLKGDQAGNWGGKMTKAKMKKSRGGSELTPMEEESLRLISQRESSLGMFHAVGKIVYNKRMDRSLLPASSTAPLPPPDYLSHYDRPKVSEVAVNELMDETGTDTGTFICALHENYPTSCHGSTFTDSVNSCIDALSDSDILSPDRRSTHGFRVGMGSGTGATPQNAGIDLLRQDEISFHVAARGLLFGLPYPVNRQISDSRGKVRTGDAYKMLYPTSLRLWRKSEEVDGLVDAWMKHTLNPFGNLNLLSQEPGSSSSTGVASWKNLRFGHAKSLKSDEGSRGPTITMMSRSDTILYQLPYVVRIKSQETSSSPLVQITRIGGDDLEDIEEDEMAPAFPPKKPAVTTKSTTFGPRLPSMDEEKLILSDDDIVDD